MRKLIMIFTLTMSILGLTTTANASGEPPACGGNCPWVR
jgi:hypothetical protein